MLTFIRSQKDKRHCFMKVPCLEIDGLVLTQSVAIMEYLADRWSIQQTVLTNMMKLAKAKMMSQQVERSLYNFCIPQFPWCWHHAKRSQNQGQGTTGKKVFCSKKIFKSHHSYWSMFIILPLFSLWNYTNVLQLVLKRYQSWYAVASSQFKTSASSRFLIIISIVNDVMISTVITSRHDLLDSSAQ